ncbi:hypothetical protein RP20_CCG019050 [Aedes albopictus]|nr:hypothetical protein RP20_CCG019050 [Aedes albopictus]
MWDKTRVIIDALPSNGPHNLCNSLLLMIFLRNRLKYVWISTEVTKICSVTVVVELGSSVRSGSSGIVHFKNANELVFATRLTNVFIISKPIQVIISLPRHKIVKRLAISKLP